MMSPAFEENRIHPDLTPLVVNNAFTPSGCRSFSFLPRAKLSLTHLRFKRAQPSSLSGTKWLARIFAKIDDRHCRQAREIEPKHRISIVLQIVGSQEISRGPPEIAFEKEMSSTRLEGACKSRIDPDRVVEIRNCVVVIALP